MLHSIGEGLVVFGRGDSDVAEVVNDEARRLLDAARGPGPRAQLPESLRTMGAGPVKDEVHLTADRVLVVNRDPVSFEGRRDRHGD